jgi:hypothetical protein
MSETITTDTPTAPDLTPVVDAYVAMWNETDPERRARHIERAWVSEGAYVDPLFQATGHAALSEMVGAAQAQYPGHSIVRTSGLDAHHQLVRFDWELRDPEGGTVLGGIDVAIVAEDGRLTRLAGFFGPAPALDG